MNEILVFYLDGQEPVVYDPSIQLHDWHNKYYWDPYSGEIRTFNESGVNRMLPVQSFFEEKVAEYISSYQNWHASKIGQSWQVENKTNYLLSQARMADAEQERKINELAEEAQKKFIDNFIQEYNIQCFFHFTDERNIASIKEFDGLQSLRQLNARGITPSAPGGNELSRNLDEQRGLDGYVHLCFYNDHPMYQRARYDGRIINARFLKISPSVLELPDILFTPSVANANDVPRYTLRSAIENMDFDAVYKYGTMNSQDSGIQSRRLATKKYELLIPNNISLEFIQGI